MYFDLPHVICLSELHLKSSELSFVNIECYTIGAHFSRALHEGGGVIIRIYIYIYIYKSDQDLVEFKSRRWLWEQWAEPVPPLLS